MTTVGKAPKSEFDAKRHNPCQQGDCGGAGHLLGGAGLLLDGAGLLLLGAIHLLNSAGLLPIGAGHLLVGAPYLRVDNMDWLSSANEQLTHAVAPPIGARVLLANSRGQPTDARE